MPVRNEREVRATAGILFLFALLAEYPFPVKPAEPKMVATPSADPNSVPPDWAVAMGHAEMWKLHHNCR